MKNLKTRARLINAVKIGCGSALAIFIAYLLGLPNPASAGSITLLALLVETRKQTIRLAGLRILSFFMTAALSYFLFHFVGNDYLAFALFMMIESFVLEMAGWQATLSVNAVIGTHFLISRDFSLSFTIYEFILVLIGISIALVLNFIQSDRLHKSELEKSFGESERELRSFLLDLSDELEKETGRKDFDKRVHDLQDRLQESISLSVTKQENSFEVGEEWYVPYFEMRYAQSAVLHEMQHHMQKVGSVCEASRMVGDTLRDLAYAVAYDESPALEFAYVKEAKKKLESLYADDSSFEDHARLLYLLNGLDEMIVLKEDFLEDLTPFQNRSYSRVRQEVWKEPESAVSAI